MSSAFQLLWAVSLSRNWRGEEKEYKSIEKWFNSAVCYLYSVMFRRSLKSIVKSNYRHRHESIIHRASGFTGSQEPMQSSWYAKPRLQLTTPKPPPHTGFKVAWPSGTNSVQVLHSWKKENHQCKALFKWSFKIHYEHCNKTKASWTKKLLNIIGKMLKICI